MLLAGGIEAAASRDLTFIDKAGDDAVKLGSRGYAEHRRVEGRAREVRRRDHRQADPGAPPPGAPGGLVNTPLTDAQKAAGYTGNAADPNAGLPPPAPEATGNASDAYAGLPPPPPNITVTNNITVAGGADKNAINGIKDAAKSGTKAGLASNRNTYDAATTGMPSSVN